MLFGGGGSSSTSTAAGNGLRTETGGFGDPNLETCSSNYENGGGGGLCNGGGGPGGGPGGGTSFRRSFRTKATYVLRPETVRQMVVITTTAKNGKRSSASAPLADLKLLQQNGGTGNGCRKNLVGTLSTEFYNRKDSGGGGGGGNPRGLRLTSSE